MFAYTRETLAVPSAPRVPSRLLPTPPGVPSTVDLGGSRPLSGTLAQQSTDYSFRP